MTSKIVDITFQIASNMNDIFSHKFVKNCITAFIIVSIVCFKKFIILSQFIIAKTINAIIAIIGNNSNSNIAITTDNILTAALTTPIAIAIDTNISAITGFSINHLNISTNPLNIFNAISPKFCPISDNPSISGCQLISAIFFDISLNLSEQLFNHF